MRFRTIVLSLLMSTLLATQLEAALHTAELEGQTYYIYEVKKDDSLFGIARRNGWDYSKLQQLNPDAVSPLKKGMKLYYPVNDTRKPAIPPEDEILQGDVTTDVTLSQALDEGREIYRIKPGDTLYGVARARRTTVEALLKANPGISETNFKAGEMILLPAIGEGVEIVAREVQQPVVAGFTLYQVGKDETWNTISRKLDVDLQNLKELNPGITKLKKGQLISVPNINMVTSTEMVVDEDPRESTAEGRIDIYDYIHRIFNPDEKAVVKLAIVSAEPSSRKDIEFIRGFLTGIDQLKNAGYKIDLKVIDGTLNGADLIAELADATPTIVFTTDDRTVSASLAEYAMVSQTPVVNTFDVRNEAFVNNPYILQLLAPTDYFSKAVADNLNRMHRNDFLLVVGDPDSDDNLVPDLLAARDASQKALISVDRLKDYEFDSSLPYLIYVTATRKGDVQKILEQVATLRSENPYLSTVVVGRPNWITYEELKPLMNKADVMIPSRFYYDEESHDAKTFRSNFKSLFGHEPIKSFPLYAGVGYDAAIYFTDGLGRNQGDLNNISNRGKGIQNDFEIYRLNNWSGLLNPVMYLIHFRPYGDVEKIDVKYNPGTE